MFDVENGHCTITTFDNFRKQLKGYFMPANAERHAYRLVANLKQTSALRDYIRAYQKVMLDVPMMIEKDKLHWFIIGLQSWAQADVERSNPETLEQAYVAAECLADTQCKSYTDTFRSTNESDHDVERKPFFRRDNNGPPREVTSWVCEGRHYMCVCPKRARPTEQANAARATEGGTEEWEGSRIGALQLLNSVKREEKAKVTVTPFKKLMYIEILVNRMPTMAIIDTGATHNFVSVVKAKKLGLTLERGELRMKAINSEAKSIHGVVRNVVVKIESWSEKANFSVVPMDDY
ncbi:hypothetical protein EJ110_NYTH13718 [Nymphaea thermarum]|nr:hypothetical protein EJ110_NYTH13718 [Nymphaea thermarum]